MWIPQIIQERNANKKVELVVECLEKNSTVLDFGCGDLSFAQRLSQKVPGLKITGVDIIDFKKRPEGIKFEKYDGKKLPFKDKSFDITISYYVLHHTENAEKYFAELLRVTKKKMILIESVARIPLDFPGMKFMDWLFNFWKKEKIPMTYQFLSKKKWHQLFKNNNLKLESEVDAEIMPIPKFAPTGRSTRFVLLK